MPLTTVTFTALMFMGGLVAGLLGSLTGLGGGVAIVPLLTIVLGVDLHYAIGASLISVIATSSGAAAAYVKEGFTNIRIGMFLEVATTFGAIGGALLAAWLAASAIAVIFGVVLLVSAGLSLHRREDHVSGGPPDRLAQTLRLDGIYPGRQGWLSYRVRRVPAGFALMLLAGLLSGLLGIGSGAMKVLAMDQVMRIPFKVSTTTSNFMIGVTAAASAGLYLHRGLIDPGLAMPVMLGVLGGALAGSYLLLRMRTAALRWIFVAVIITLGLEMIRSGIRGEF